VLKFVVNGRQSAGAKRVSGVTRLIASEVNAVLADRESDVGIQIVRLHGKKVLAGHGTEVDRGNHVFLLLCRGRWPYASSFTSIGFQTIAATTRFHGAVAGVPYYRLAAISSVAR
jgi:hypothetical protein